MKDEIALSNQTQSGETEYVIPSVELSDAAKERIQAMQYLSSAPDKASYLQRQRAVAKQLGMTVRNVQRLMQQWRNSGMSGIIRHSRKDIGSHRVNQQWHNFILKTYREGNRGSRRLSRAQVAVLVAARAQELGICDYPSRATVYRILQSEMDKQAQKQRKRSLGWSGEKLTLKTREGLEIEIVNSNQVWQCDHTKLDILVVSQSGELLGRPWLTTVVDTHSRAIVGMYLGMEARSSDVVCLALRHAILPKQYSSAYELSLAWGTYGIPQYLYTDGGKEFNSNHLEQVASQLKIVLCQRRYPSEGGIVERPFGTFNTELLSTLPGYTGSNVKQRPKEAEKEASLTLEQLERLLVRYLVERYNQSLDPRTGSQTRLGRWEEGLLAQLPLLSDRELDICLMRRSRRVVYRGGYIQFANLTYKGEHLEGYTGTWVVLRYNPRDVTTILIYQIEGSKERFLTRAHAIGLETEALSLIEAQAMSRSLRQSGRLATNQSILKEVRLRSQEVIEHIQGKRKRKSKTQTSNAQLEQKSSVVMSVPEAVIENSEDSECQAVMVVPEVEVHDYEEWQQGYWL
ncbi:transposase [Mastigocladus laminosus UU774]|nr:transposase [Mastigocladus laminosus UU774]